MVASLVRAVGVDTATDRPVVLLQSTSDDERILPISLGEPEAVALASAIEGQPPPGRPDTHRLVADVLAAFHRRLAGVRVHTLRDGIFHAALDLDDGTTVDSRASDALVLAMLAGAGIDVADGLYEEAGVGPRAVTVEGAGVGDPVVEEFRQFLDTASPEDFDDRF